MRVEGELSFKEIAQVVGTTEETARWRVFRARRMLVDLVPEEVPHDRKAKGPLPLQKPQKGGAL